MSAATGYPTAETFASTYKIGEWVYVEVDALDVPTVELRWVSPSVAQGQIVDLAVADGLRGGVDRFVRLTDRSRFEDVRYFRKARRVSAAR